MPHALLKILLRFVLFFALIVPLYLLVLLAAANAPERVQKSLRALTSLPVGVVKPGGNSLPRFQEISSYHDVDILFAGSSHCYRAFDPRFFAGHGLKVFNMGSMSQSPVNTYFLLRDHLASLRPRLIVLEVYWVVLQGDGVESVLDLCANSPINRGLAEMALATRSLTAVNGLLLNRLDLRRPPLSQLNYMPRDSDVYIPGGYVDKIPGWESPKQFAELRPRPLNPVQTRYLKKIVQLAREQSIPLVLVSQPVPREKWLGVSNRDDIAAAMAKLVAECQVTWIDFNPLLALDTRQHFFDDDHLNREGVRLFEERLWEEFQARKILPPPR
jgi:hypothetical protein